MIGRLQQQVQAIQEQMGSAQFQWDEERLRLAATQEQLTQDLTLTQASLQQVLAALLHVHSFAILRLSFCPATWNIDQLALSFCIGSPQAVCP